MTTTTPAAPTPTTIERLQGELNAMLNPLDIPRSWTQREVNTYEAKRRLLDMQIRIVRMSSAELAEVEPQIATLTAQRDDLVAVRAELEAELATVSELLPQVTAHSVFERHHWLAVSIRVIDNEFDLMNELIPERGLPLFDKLRDRKYGTASNWNPMSAFFGALPTIEVRLRDLVKRRDEAQRQLNSVA